MQAAEQMPDPDPKVVRRIANLLRIAQRNHGPEAETARMFAKRLMVHHNINVVLDAGGAGPQEKPKSEHRAVEVCKEPEWWRSLLLNDLVGSYGCTTVAGSASSGRWILWLSGPPDQVHRCAIHYEYLIGQIRKVVREVGPDIFYDDAVWTEGVACGVLQYFADELKGKTHLETEFTEPDEAEGALVPVNQPQRVEADTDDDAPEVPKLPIVNLDPPGIAMRKGYMFGAGRSPYAPAIAYGAVEALSIRPGTANALIAAGVSRVYDLLRMRPKQLRFVPGIGLRRCVEILRALGEHDLELRPDW